jgi:small subunit ribosomal protein S2
MDKKMLTEMFDNLLHIGNKTNYWNPQMKNFIYGSSNGVHIIDLTKTAMQIEKVSGELQALSKEGKKILFVATKLQARGAFARLAEDNGHFFVSEKWVPGLLTNFRTIKTRIATYLKLIRDNENGGFDMLTKKERASKLLELEKLDKAFRGLKLMKRTPDAIFVVDGVYEDQAVREALSLGIPCYGISNTNGNPYEGNGVIPANTNSVKSLDYLAGVLANGIKSVPAKKPVGAKVSAAKPAAKKTAPKAEAAKSEEK